MINSFLNLTYYYFIEIVVFCRMDYQNIEYKSLFFLLNNAKEKKVEYKQSPIGWGFHD